MALLLDVALNSGLNVNGAYARIDTISGSKDGLNITLNYYVDQQAFTDGKSYVKQEVYYFVPSVADGADNFIKQGYVYLKTLDAFATATDA